MGEGKRFPATLTSGWGSRHRAPGRPQDLTPQPTPLPGSPPLPPSFSEMKDLLIPGLSPAAPPGRSLLGTGKLGERPLPASSQDKKPPPTLVSGRRRALFRNRFALCPRQLLGGSFLIVGEESCQRVFQVSGEKHRSDRGCVRETSPALRFLLLAAPRPRHSPGSSPEGTDSGPGPVVQCDCVRPAGTQDLEAGTAFWNHPRHQKRSQTSVHPRRERTSTLYKISSVMSGSKFLANKFPK